MRREKQPLRWLKRAALLALTALLRREKAGADEWFGGVLLSAIALLRLPEAIDFLLGLIEREERAAAGAIDALSRVATGDDLRARLERAVESTGSRRLEEALKEAAARR